MALITRREPAAAADPLLLRSLLRNAERLRAGLLRGRPLRPAAPAEGAARSPRALPGGGRGEDREGESAGQEPDAGDPHPRAIRPVDVAGDRDSGGFVHQRRRRRGKEEVTAS